MPSLRRPSRPAALLALLGVLVLILLVLVAVRAGDDGPELRLERGAPAKGFPLRGDLSGDRETLEAAARRWMDRDQDQEDGERVFDPSDERVEVTALWAGRVGDERRVVLAEDHTAALLGTEGRRGGEPFWRLYGTTRIVDEDDPRLVPFAAGVLVAADAKAVFRTARVGVPDATALDGFWRARSPYASADLDDGVLVLPDGLRRGALPREQTPTVVVTGEGALVRTVDPPLARDLAAGVPGEAPPALRRFVVAARTGPTREGGTFAAYFPPRVRLVGETVLPRVGATTVVATIEPGSQGRPLLSAAVGGTSSGNGPPPDGVTLPTPRRGEGLAADFGPAAGAAYVQQRTAADDAIPFLMLAAQDPVRRFEILEGTSRRVVDGPVAAVRATWRRVSPGGSSQVNDVVIVGRTASGAVVPLGPVSGAVTAVGDRP
jgi:hypothetical protein